MSVFSYRRCHRSLKDEKELLPHRPGAYAYDSPIVVYVFATHLHGSAFMVATTARGRGVDAALSVLRKLFNTFAESLNEEKFDFLTWQPMRDAWRKLEAE